MRVWRSLVALLVLAVLLVGMPWAILRWGDWTIVRMLQRDPQLLFQPDNGQVVLGVLTLVGVVAWVILAWSIVLEVIDAFRRRGSRRGRTSRSRFLGFSRGLVRPLVTAAFALAVVGGGTSGGEAPVGAPVAVQAEVGVLGGLGEGVRTPGEAGVRTPGDAGVRGEAGLGSPGEAGVPIVGEQVIRTPGEVGVRTLGEVSVVGDSGDSGEFELTRPLGPADADVSRTVKVGTLYVVEPGDSLWSIAEQAYGNGEQWPVIAQANENLVQGTGALIQVGWQLTIPALEGNGRLGAVTVQEGQSLWQIAEQQTGDGHRWPELALANQGLVSDPNLIQPGWELVLPSSWGIVGADRGTDFADGEQTDPSTDPAGPTDVRPESNTPTSTPGTTPGNLTNPDTTDTTTESTTGTTPDYHPADDAQDSTLTNSEDAVDPGTGTSTETGPDLPDSTNASASPMSSDNPANLGANPDTPGSTTGGFPAPTSTNAPDRTHSAPSEAPTATPTQEQQETDDDQLLGIGGLDVVGQALGVGTVLAGGMIMMVRRRRLNQLRARPIGRRIMLPGEEAQRLESAFSLVACPATPSNPDAGLARLAAILDSPPSTASVGLGTDPSASRTPNPYISLHSTNEETGMASIASSAGDRTNLPDRNPTPDPIPLTADSALVIRIGEDAQGDPVTIDISETQPLVVTGGTADLQRVMSGIAMSLAVDECTTDVELHVVTSGDLFDTFDAVESHRNYHSGLTSLRQVASERRQSLDGRVWADLRADPDFGEAWREVIYCFLECVNEAEVRELASQLEGPPIGVAVLVPKNGPDGDIAIESSQRAWAGGESVRPFALEVSAPLTELLETSVDNRTTLAWWSSDRSDPPEAPEPRPTTAPRDSTTFNHPTLRLLGPIVLEGACGEPPPRAERACMEYCGWLLEHPGTTATAMALGLMVAEGTRRSNMSRLRTWLGNDPDGHSYLPEAYSGRIWLDPAVTSDWQRLRLLIANGVEQAPVEQLVEALEMVRGAPLADASPGQWHWAEELRLDMVSVIRDIGAVATRKLLTYGHIDQARWATTRALTAAPEDELLLCARVVTEHAAGNRLEVERLVSWIGRNARNLGIDLLPQTVTTLQRVLSGQNPVPPQTGVRG